jgi:two-component system CheB/CheR fusion protein
MRVVAIGASAGGLEALEQFFRAMPPDTGFAFVVVQHLSPDFRSMMDELLARHSSMRIAHAADGLALASNTIYLNPPRQHLMIESGRFTLKRSDRSEIPSHPIDALFRSVAQQYGAAAIGIILSGTGSDGTIGSLAIREAGGTVLVQEPRSAKFDTMPRSVIERNAATATVLADAMAAALGRIARGESIGGGDEEATNGSETPTTVQAAQADILRLLQKRYGANFAYYKTTTIGRRLKRRVLLNHLEDIPSYLAFVKETPAELDVLYADLLIGVTSFFRDAAAFELLRTTVIPKLASQMSDDRQIRVWVAGCATGEEAYSIAILFSEYAHAHDVPLNVKIFATDLHQRSLEYANQGHYSAESLKGLDPALVARYFERVGVQYQVSPALRRLIVFSPHNLIKDPPFTRIDLLSCRNVLIYFNEVAQQKVLALFHFALARDGILFLGQSETLGSLQDEFEALDRRWRLYRKLRQIQLPGSTRLLPDAQSDGVDPVHASRDYKVRVSASATANTLERRSLLKAYDALLARYAPAALLVDRHNQVCQIFNGAEPFLRLKPGLMSARATDLVVEELRSAVSACLDATWSRRLAQTRRVILNKGGNPRVALIRTERLTDRSDNADYLLLTIEEETSRRRRVAAPIGSTPSDAPVDGHITERLQSLERDLQITEESLQTTIEELETSNEELQATNQELMSANEELQSTNEELHAVNEELYTVSSEHQRKIDELTALTNDMDHLLRATEVGTIFLDRDLRIRRFTPAIAKTFNLLARDTGRPIEHITARFTYASFKTDLVSVLNGGPDAEHSVDVDGRTFLLRVLPFRVEGIIEGLVITMFDITALKEIETSLAIRNEELGRANRRLEEFTYIVSHDLRAPLRTILNSAKWIEEDLADHANDEIRAHVHRLMTYSERLTNMLNELMAYARLDSQVAPVETVTVEPMIRSIAEAVDSENRLDLKFNGDNPTFATYRAPLQLVFQNLIDNALKYCDLPKVEVVVSAEDRGREFHFTVTDNGPGIPVRHHEKVFLPFRKLEHASERPGTGMGLALVRKAIQDNGGTIEVLSNPEVARGTTFRFTWRKIEPLTEPGAPSAVS